MSTIKSPKKLIEVALPLDKINEAAAREKSIRHGHPSTLHLWWARRPLAAARAVIFAQMVNDPGFQSGDGFRYGMNKEKAAIERERLFKIIEDLVLWENTTNEEVLDRARAEIWRSWRETCELNKNHPQAAELFNPEKLPAFHDPFAGGGALPLEAQRLGLESYASDLNPVAVTINKAMIEIPPKFAGRAPVGPLLKGDKQAALHEGWKGAQGLAEDVRRYGAWMREEAQRRVGNLYPKITVTKSMAEGRPDLKPYIGNDLTVIAWIWARTVFSPNPAYSSAHVPLMKSFRLSAKQGKEVWVEPVVNKSNQTFNFDICVGEKHVENDGTVGRKGAVCIFSETPISLSYIREQGKAGRLGQTLVAIVAEGRRGRVYLPAQQEHVIIANCSYPDNYPTASIEHWSGCTNSVVYGLDTFEKLFTKRQLNTITAFSSLTHELFEKIKKDAHARETGKYHTEIDSADDKSIAYAHAVCIYIAFAIDKLADLNNNLCRWEPLAQCPRQLFGKQAIPMIWDFAEANPFSTSSGSWESIIDGISNALIKNFENCSGLIPGLATQADAQRQKISINKVVSTDPPYYDNVPYSNLSDFFYIWMRRSLRNIIPELFQTKVVPRIEELVATASRHGGKESAETFFLNGMTSVMHNLADGSHESFPVTIYYAFRQSETTDTDGTSSTGWETFLQSVITAGFSITGTWPMRTENASRMRGQNSNALASSIVLVCRKRPINAPTTSRRDFIRELNTVLPQALEEMTRGGVNSPVAPVDLSQAIIGPGMAIFSQYSAVLEADGAPMRVKTALQLINRFLAEDDFDHDTQFCLHWFEQQGWATGQYGEAEVLARAKGTSVGGLVEAGVVESGGGNMRLLKWVEMPHDWSPDTDTRTPIWEALHQLIRALNQDGESVAGRLLARMAEKAEPIRALAYRLYTLCERQGWAEDARAYNELVTAWTGIEKAASETGHQTQMSLLD